MNKYYDWNRTLSKELCCEMEKFENKPTCEGLKNIKNLIKSMVGLQELEAAGAMRKYFEDEHGYDSVSGEFDDRGRSREYYYPHHGIYNAVQPYPTYPYSPYINPNGVDDESMMRWDGRYGEPMNRGRSRDSRGRYNDGRDGMRGRDEERDGYRIYNHADPEKAKSMKKLTDSDYDKWLEDMEGADGTMGPMWTEDETSSVAKKIGIDFKKYTPKVFQVAMDMMYSDYCEVAEKFDVDKPEFYAEMAKAYLEDEDSIKGGDKLSAYYEYIVEK